MKRSLSLVSAAMLLGVAHIAGLSSGAGATSSTSVSVGNPISVTNRLLVTVPVEIVCAPLSGDVDFGSSLVVDIKQASGKSVSEGTAFVGGMEGGTVSVTCDGSTVNTVPVTVVGDGPFHGGGAVAFVSFEHEVGTCTSPFGCQVTASDSGTFGPAGVRLRG